jgi:hypothetical protein
LLLEKKRSLDYESAICATIEELESTIASFLSSVHDGDVHLFGEAAQSLTSFLQTSDELLNDSHVSPIFTSAQSARFVCTVFAMFSTRLQPDCHLTAAHLAFLVAQCAPAHLVCAFFPTAIDGMTELIVDPQSAEADEVRQWLIGAIAYYLCCDGADRAPVIKAVIGILPVLLNMEAREPVLGFFAFLVRCHFTALGHSVGRALAAHALACIDRIEAPSGSCALLRCLCARDREFFAECTAPFLMRAFARLLDASDPAARASGIYLIGTVGSCGCDALAQIVAAFLPNMPPPGDAKDVYLAFVWMVKRLAQVDAEDCDFAAYFARDGSLAILAEWTAAEDFALREAALKALAAAFVRIPETAALRLIRDGFLDRIASVYEAVKMPGWLPLAIGRALEIISRMDIDERIAHAMDIAENGIITAVLTVQEEVGDDFEVDDIARILGLWHSLAGTINSQQEMSHE